MTKTYPAARYLVAIGLLLFPLSDVCAQLIISGGTINIEAGAVVSVHGDLTSNTDIVGGGKVVLNGTTSQSVNTNGYSIPNLEIANASNIILAGNTKVPGSLLFTTGKIQAGDNIFTLGSAATVTGAGAGMFVETNGTGQLRKEVTAPGNVDLPVGTGNMYMPLQFQVTGTVGVGAYVGTQLIAGAHPKKPARATDYMTAYWKTAYAGITGGTINTVATYADVASVSGNENLLTPMRYVASEWSLANNTIDPTTNTITYNAVESGSELFATNKFLLMSAKVFLQGAFNGTSMNDNLRSAGVLPLTDPYRTAPYSNFFTHTNNPETEIVNSSVFANQGNDNNIVDWVFLELRNAAGALVQTRSALLQKDGDVVDVDGVNPVFFKNLDAANFVLTVRHRNHLGLSFDLANAKQLSVANPVDANTFNFTTATDAQLFGDGQAYYTNGTVKMLWAGNANSNGTSRYSGPSNDHSYLLATELSGNGSTVIPGVYKSGDLNMNGNVRYSGPSNDHTFLLTNVLAGNGSTVITQQILP